MNYPNQARAFASAMACLVLAAPLAGANSDDVINQVSKSILIYNTSKSSMKLGMLPADQEVNHKTPGTLKASTFNAAKSKLTALKGDLDAGDEITIAPGSKVLLTPVPTKSWWTTVNPTSRPFFLRVCYLEATDDSEIIYFLLKRDGSGDKLVDCEVVDPEDQAKFSRTFTVGTPNGVKTITLADR